MVTKALGRIRPLAIHDTPRFRIVVHKDGRLRYVPRLVAHHYHMEAAGSPPIVTTWMQKMTDVVRQMYGNDTKGDCVIASLLKVFGGWTVNDTGTPALSSTSEALSIYSTVCGPGDNGCEITSVLDYAQSNGIPVGGIKHKIAGYAAVNPADQNIVSVCTQVFGPSIKLGINLPQTWYDLVTANGFIWDTPPGTDKIVGGHDVPIVDVNEQGVVILTWAMWGTITWRAMAAHFKGQPIVEEAYVSLGPDWYGKDNLAPNGINATTLAADLALVVNGQIPPVAPPTPVPTPTPTPLPLFKFTLHQTHIPGYPLYIRNVPGMQPGNYMVFNADQTAGALSAE